METYEYEVDLECEKKRLDVFLSETQNEITRSHIQKLIESECATVNGKPGKSSYRLRLGDHVCLQVPDPVPLDLEAEDIPLDIIFEDEYLLAVDKPAGMTVHPAPGNLRGTLVNAVLFHCKDLKGIGGVERPGIVHRLDKDTSGLIVVAKTEAAHRSLAAQFKERTVRKTYLALARGVVKESKGTMTGAIGRHRTERKKMSVHPEGGREAETRFEVIRRFEKFTYLRLSPKTGRTHQIRVHLAAMGHPVLGDELYGGRSASGLKKMPRHALHAHRLSLVHPHSGEALELESPLPADMSNFLEAYSGTGEGGEK